MIFLNVHRNWTLSTKSLTVSLSRPITSGTLTIYWRRCGNTWDSSECESIMLVISKSCSSRVLVLAEFDNKTLYLLLPCASRAFSVFLMSFYDITKTSICRVFSNLAKIIFSDKVKLENLSCHSFIHNNHV